MRCIKVCIKDDDETEPGEDLISFKDAFGDEYTMIKKDGKGIVNKDGKDFNW